MRVRAAGADTAQTAALATAGSEVGLTVPRSRDYRASPGSVGAASMDRVGLIAASREGSFGEPYRLRVADAAPFEHHLAVGDSPGVVSPFEPVQVAPEARASLDARPIARRRRQPVQGRCSDVRQASAKAVRGASAARLATSSGLTSSTLAMRVCSVRFASVVCPASEAFGFERVTCGFGGGFECGHRFSGASGTFQEVTAGCNQSGAVIAVESIEGGESGIRSVRHADGDGVADSRRR